MLSQLLDMPMARGGLDLCTAERGTVNLLDELHHPHAFVCAVTMSRKVLVVRRSHSSKANARAFAGQGSSTEKDKATNCDDSASMRDCCGSNATSMQSCQDVQLLNMASYLHKQHVEQLIEQGRAYFIGVYKNMHCCAVVLENDDVEHLVGIAIDQPDPGHESTCMPQQDNKNSNKKNCDDKTLGDCVNNQMVSAIPSVSLSETGATAGVLSNEWSPPLWMRLRSCGATLVDWQASAVSHALALAVWHRTTRYCCVCSGLLTMTAGGWETLCRQCHRIEYPRQDPAIIVAVTDEKDRLFLAHNILWENPRSMSVIAGYVEAGESPEQAVIRESKEETNLELYDVTYVGSQAWPFPRSLMMGYRARAHSTQLQLQEDELSCGEFFTREQFIQSVRNATINPAGPATLAAVLIEDWLGQAIPYPHDLPIW